VVRSVFDWKVFYGTTPASKANACYNQSIKYICTRRILEPGAKGLAGTKGVKHSAKAFKLHRILDKDGKERTVLHYKEFATDPLWMPFVRVGKDIKLPHETDPEGIPMFDSDPKGSPLEARLRTALGREEQPPPPNPEDEEEEEELEPVKKEEEPAMNDDDENDDENDDDDDDDDDEAEAEEAVVQPLKRKVGKGGQRKPRKRVQAKKVTSAPRKEAKEVTFDPAAIVAAVVELQNVMVEGSFDMITPKHIDEWRAWAVETPVTLAGIAPSERRVVPVFPKCEKPAPGFDAATKAREQIELICWEDPRSHRGVGEKALKQEQRERRALTVSEMAVGQLCLFQPTGERLPQANGVSLAGATPFVLGLVLEIHEGATPLRVHWLASFCRGNKCSDPDGVWHPLCRQGCQFTGQCRMTNDHEAWTDDVALDTVVWNGARLTKQFRLGRASAKKIGSLGDLLGSTTLRFDEASDLLTDDPVL
jgi:hypothetical protein